MDNKRTGTKQKIQFEFSIEALNKLDALKEDIDAPTRADVMRRALRLYEWLVTKVDPDFLVIVQDKEGREVYKTLAETLR